MAKLTAQYILDSESKMREMGINPPYIAIAGTIDAALEIFRSSIKPLPTSFEQKMVKVGTEWKCCWYIGKIGNTEVYANG